ncbi:CsbD family protein [Agromyces lapidis]|uniref:CsbD family protein n=1 Tax=Agromyces lapidis TaxID=279574 RepID=A0ABV5SP93_9MICO|nr:CsbD family protein [Agromyces lapidis]
MGTEDKMGNAAERMAGKAKEGVGKLTDDERLEAEGKADQVKADVKDAGEKVKDAVDDATN